MQTVAIGILKGKRTSFVRLVSSRKHMPRKFEAALFATLHADPAISDCFFDAYAEDMIRIDHEESMTSDGLKELFLSIASKTGVTVTITVA